MTLFYREPLRDLNNRLRIPTTSNYIDDNDIYENVWLPIGDDKESDIERLIHQQRITD